MGSSSVSQETLCRIAEQPTTSTQSSNPANVQAADASAGLFKRLAIAFTRPVIVRVTLVSDLRKVSAYCLDGVRQTEQRRKNHATIRRYAQTAQIAG